MAVQVITAALLLQIKTALQTAFNKGLANPQEDWKKVAQLIPSSGASNTYAWLSQFPAFREWVGSRLHKEVKERAMQVFNRKFETTIDIPREAIEDDLWHVYAGVAESAGVASNDLKNDLVFEQLAKGFETTCYDGQNFFDTDHPVYSNEDGTGTAVTVSNMHTGTGESWALLCTRRAPKPLYLQQRIEAQFDAITSVLNETVFDYDVYSYGGRWRGEAVPGFWQLAFGSKETLEAASFNDAFKAMTKGRGDGNRVLNIVPNLLVVGPDNQGAAEELLKAVTKDGGGSNTNYNKVELFVSPYMSAGLTFPTTP